MTSSSSSVGLFPRDLITAPSSLVDTDPSPSLSNIMKVSLNESNSASVSFTEYLAPKLLSIIKIWQDVAQCLNNYQTWWYLGWAGFAGQTSLTNIGLKMVFFLEFIVNVPDLYTCFLGLGGAPRPCLSLHIAQGFSNIVVVIAVRSLVIQWWLVATFTNFWVRGPGAEDWGLTSKAQSWGRQ